MPVLIDARLYASTSVLMRGSCFPLAILLIRASAAGRFLVGSTFIFQKKSRYVRNSGLSFRDSVLWVSLVSWMIVSLKVSSSGVTFLTVAFSMRLTRTWRSGKDASTSGLIVRDVMGPPRYRLRALAY